MAGPAFDPNGAVRFDLRSGAASDSRGNRLVLLPSAALAGLDADALGRMGDVLGRVCGARVAARLGGDAGVRGLSVEVAIAHIAGELAISGLGMMHVERWGKAMVAVVENPSISDDAFVGAALGGALSAASGRTVAAAPLGREAGRARFFLGSGATAKRVTALVGEGRAFSDIIASIQGGTA